MRNSLKIQLEIEINILIPRVAIRASLSGAKRNDLGLRNSCRDMYQNNRPKGRDHLPPIAIPSLPSNQ